MSMSATLARYGALIREQRQRLGLTQREAADRAGLTERTLRRIERGGFVSLPHLLLLAPVLRLIINVESTET